ncbi:CBS domain-containing protein [Verrucomicrobia bacterium S94]|nr:CBS domain-containing protein [Verrucomicrobia bacterium S94]
MSRPVLNKAMSCAASTVPYRTGILRRMSAYISLMLRVRGTRLHLIISAIRNAAFLCCPPVGLQWPADGVCLCGFDSADVRFPGPHPVPGAGKTIVLMVNHSHYCTNSIKRTSMKNSLEKTTVKDIAHLINSTCLRAESDVSLEKLASALCASDRSKVYLENASGRLVGVIQAKQIAVKMLELSRNRSEEADLLPAISYVLNFFRGHDLAEHPVTVQTASPLKEVLDLMQLNHIREIAVVDSERRLVGTLEAKNILSHYLQAKAEAML